jgi:hypothetical protein
MTAFFIQRFDVFYDVARLDVLFHGTTFLSS